jgi:CDP-diglyceride synthetase
MCPDMAISANYFLMSHFKQQVARAFAFSGAALMIGVIIFFFTQGLIPFVELPDIAGSVFAIGFILVFLNLSFVLSRRFCSKTFEMERFPYILGFFIALPTLVLSLLTERFSGATALLLFFAIVIISSITGSYLGIKSGGRKRDKLIQEALESGKP